MNIMIRREQVPQHYKRGYIAPTPKIDKDPTIKDNNRGITLLPIVYKLLEMVLLEREKPWLDRDDVIDEGAGRGPRKMFLSTYINVVTRGRSS